MDNQVTELITKRKMLEAAKELNRRHYRNCLEEAAKAEKTATAWRKTAQTYADKLAEQQEEYYELGTKLEKLTGSKRIK